MARCVPRSSRLVGLCAGGLVVGLLLSRPARTTIGRASCRSRRRCRRVSVRLGRDDPRLVHRGPSGRRRRGADARRARQSLADGAACAHAAGRRIFRAAVRLPGAWREHRLAHHLRPSRRTRCRGGGRLRSQTDARRAGRRDRRFPRRSRRAAGARHPWRSMRLSWRASIPTSMPRPSNRINVTLGPWLGPLAVEAARPGAGVGDGAGPRDCAGRPSADRSYGRRCARRC